MNQGIYAGKNSYGGKGYGTDKNTGTSIQSGGSSVGQHEQNNFYFQNGHTSTSNTHGGSQQTVFQKGNSIKEGYQTDGSFQGNQQKQQFHTGGSSQEGVYISGGQHSGGIYQGGYTVNGVQQGGGYQQNHQFQTGGSFQEGVYTSGGQHTGGVYQGGYSVGGIQQSGDSYGGVHSSSRDSSQNVGGHYPPGFHPLEGSITNVIQSTGAGNVVGLKNHSNVHESESSISKETKWDEGGPVTFINKSWQTNDNGVRRNGSSSTIVPGYSNGNHFFEKENTDRFFGGEDGSQRYDFHNSQGGTVIQKQYGKDGSVLTTIDEGTHSGHPRISQKEQETQHVYHVK